MTRKYERCVRKVKKSLRKYGRKGNPYAICRAAMKSNRRKKTMPYRKKWGRVGAPNSTKRRRWMRKLAGAKRGVVYKRKRKASRFYPRSTRRGIILRRKP